MNHFRVYSCDVCIAEPRCSVLWKSRKKMSGLVDSDSEQRGNSWPVFDHSAVTVTLTITGGLIRRLLLDLFHIQVSGHISGRKYSVPCLWAIILKRPWKNVTSSTLAYGDRSRDTNTLWKQGHTLPTRKFFLYHSALKSTWLHLLMFHNFPKCVWPALCMHADRNWQESNVCFNSSMYTNYGPYFLALCNVPCMLSCTI